MLKARDFIKKRFNFFLANFEDFFRATFAHCTAERLFEPSRFVFNLLMYNVPIPFAARFLKCLTILGHYALKG